MNSNQEHLLEDKSKKSQKSKSSQLSAKDCIKKLSLNNQIKLLTIKNLRIFQRNLSFFGYHAMIFLMVFLWMVLVSYLIKNQSSLVHTATFPSSSLEAFQKCGDSPLDNLDNCLSLGVILVNDSESETQDWIQKALYDLKQKHGLKQDSDIKIIYSGNKMEDVYDKMQDFSEIKSMLTFCNNYNIFKNSTMSLQCDSLSYGAMGVDVNVYGVHYNSTKLAPNYLRDTGTPIKSDNNAILLKMSVDESIINYYREHPSSDQYFTLPYNPVKTCSKKSSSSAKNPKKTGGLLSSSEIKSQLDFEDSSFSYDFKIMDYPKPKNRFIEKFDSSNQWGSFYYMFIILLSFVKFAQYIAKEKDQKLRKGLIPLGLNHFSYWFSWIICIGVFDIFFTCCIVFGGMALGFPMFREIVFILPFIVILLCLWSYRFLAILVITACDNYRSATKANYTILVVSIFLQGKIK